MEFGFDEEMYFDKENYFERSLTLQVQYMPQTRDHWSLMAPTPKNKRNIVASVSEEYSIQKLWWKRGVRSWKRKFFMEIPNRIPYQLLAASKTTAWNIGKIHAHFWNILPWVSKVERVGSRLAGQGIAVFTVIGRNDMFNVLGKLFQGC